LNDQLGVEILIIYWSSLGQIFLVGFRTKQIGSANLQNKNQ